MDKVTAILLAAGMSRRMGTNKLLLDYRGKPMVKHVLDTLTASEADEVIVVASEISIHQLRDFLDPDILLVDNPNYKSGMTSSIQAGVNRANPEYACMVCLADQPLITVKDYNQIIGAYREKVQKDHAAIVLPAFDGRKGNPVIFSPYYRELILTHQEPEGCKEIVQQHPDHIYTIEVGTKGILTDVDTPERYRKITGKK